MHIALEMHPDNIIRPLTQKSGTNSLQHAPLVIASTSKEATTEESKRMNQMFE
jgi:hypothetical protein